MAKKRAQAAEVYVWGRGCKIRSGEGDDTEEEAWRTPWDKDQAVFEDNSYKNTSQSI